MKIKFSILPVISALLCTLSISSFANVQDTPPQIYPLSSIRTEGIQGIRFKASVTVYQKEIAEEYGFIVTTKTRLDNANLSGNELVFGADVLYSHGAAYDKELNIDSIYEILKDDVFFVGVLTGIPEAKSCYEELIVVRPYIKYAQSNYVYGNFYERSILDVAKALRDGGYKDMSDDAKKKIEAILEICGTYTEKKNIFTLDADNHKNSPLLFPQGTSSKDFCIVNDPLEQMNKVYFMEAGISDKASWTYLRTADLDLIPGQRYCLEYDILPGQSAVGTNIDVMTNGICYRFADNASSKIVDHGVDSTKVLNNVWSRVKFVYTFPENADASRETSIGIYSTPMSISGYDYKVPVDYYIDNVAFYPYDGDNEDGFTVTEHERQMIISYDYLNKSLLDGVEYDTSEIYSLYKSEQADNYYSYLAKLLNSEKFTSETQKSMKDISDVGVQYCHMGQLIINDGICYASYLQNTGDDGEDHTSTTSGVVLAIFPLDRAMSSDFDAEEDIEFYLVGSLGDSCAGLTAASIYKDNSMCLVGNKMYICFSFTADDGLSYIFSKAFDITKKEWVEENLVKLNYKGTLYDFTDKSINIVYKDKGLPERARSLIELVSQWSEYKGEYYATGITIGGSNNGFIVKTKDFKTMTLVDAIPFNDYGESEVSSYIYKGKLFVACRQQNGKPYMYLGYLDLDTLTWGHYYKIADGNSRPWFFEKGGSLYLLHTTEEIYRRYTNISRIRVTDHDYNMMGDIHPIDTVATIKNCGSYFATCTYNNEVYFVCTQNTEKFGKLCLDFYNEDTVNNMLLDLLG